MSQPIEIWKDVVGYEGLYQVSNLGRVKSLKRVARSLKSDKWYSKKERILKNWVCTNKRSLVALCKEGKMHRQLAYRLVAKAFLPNHNNLPTVNHKNGNVQDNRVENLEWMSHSQNSSHSIHVLKNKPYQIPVEINHVAVKAYKLSGEYVGEYKSILEAASNLGVNKSSISAVLSGRQKYCGKLSSNQYYFERVNSHSSH